jgi:HlyD family secretion protein
MIREPSTMDRPVTRPTRSRLWIGVGLLGLVVAAFLLAPTVRRWTSADRSVARAQLRFGRVVKGDLEYTIAVQGRVVAGSRPTLFSPADGIVALRVHAGQQIVAGEILAEVESPELESRVQQEEATQEALESDLQRLGLSHRQRDLENQQAIELAEVRAAAAGRLVERNEKLFELGLVNEIDLETSRDASRVAELELEQSRQRLGVERDMREFELKDARLKVERQRLLVRELSRQVGALQLVAPFDGLVATLPAEDRDAVVRGQPLIGVVDLRDLEVEIEIPEAAADEVSPGMAAVVETDGVDHHATLTRVAPEVHDGQVLGRVTFDGGLPPGLRQNQRLSTRLVLDRRVGVLKVPRGPWLESGGGHRVFVVSDGLARLRDIEVGTVSVSEVEIVDGIEAGEEIVLSDMSRFEPATTVLLRN